MPRFTTANGTVHTLSIERPDDADNPLRVAFGNEASDRDIEEFARRFDCQITDGFGSTQSAVIVTRPPGTPRGSIGQGMEGVAIYDALGAGGARDVVLGRRLREAPRITDVPTGDGPGCGWLRTQAAVVNGLDESCWRRPRHRYVLGSLSPSSSKGALVRLHTPAFVMALVLPTLALLGLPGPAHAATSYTWTGATSSAWGTAGNWSPAGVPTTGDSVSVNGASATNLALTGVPAIDLQDLSVTTAPGKNISLAGAGPVSVAGAFSWSGGDLDVPLTLAGTGTVATAPANAARFGSGGNQLLTVSGTLTFTGPGAASANALSSVELMFDSGITVLPSGRIDLGNGARILSNRCCSGSTATLVNQGTLRALGGLSHLDHLGLDQSGTIEVALGATLDAVGGPMRVYGGTVTGGGTLSVPATAGDSFDALHPANPDNTLKLLGNLSLAAGSTLALGGSAEVSGAGTISGAGAVRLAGARVRGAVTFGVPVATVSGTTSRLAVWDNNVAGQHGDVVLAAGGQVAPGSTLAVNGGTRLTVPAGQSLSLPPGSTLSSDGCCSNPGQLVVNGSLAVDAATLRWVVLAGSGRVTQAGASTWDLAGTAFSPGAVVSGSGVVNGDLPSGAATLAPAGLLRVTGDFLPGASGTLVVDAGRLQVDGDAELAGTLRSAAAQVARNRTLDVVSAHAVRGTFGCASTPAAVAIYTKTKVTLLGVRGTPPDCLVAAQAKALKAKFSGTRVGKLKPTKGATRVLLEVTLKGAVAAARLKLRAGSSATVKVGKGKSVTAYVVLRLAKGAKAKKLTASIGRRTSVTVTQIGCY